MSSATPEWVDGPPVPRQELCIPGDTEGKLYFQLRWRFRGSKNRPEEVVDRTVFEAAVYTVGLGQETEGVAILESLGYEVSRLKRTAGR
jgi:hypothetical protein